MRGAQRGRNLSSAMRTAALLAMGSGVGAPLAQADPPGKATVARATAPLGITAVAVTTSPAYPDSKTLLQSLRVHPWIVANAQRIKLVEIAGETQPSAAAPRA